MDGSIHQMLLYFVPCTTYVCMYVCMYTPFAVAFAFHRRTSTNGCIFLYQSLKKGKTDRQTDGTTERTERNGTKERNRKAQKTKTKSQKKKSVSISNHLLITMNNSNMDGWNRLIFIPISPLFPFFSHSHSHLSLSFPFFPLSHFFLILSFFLFLIFFFPFSHIFLRSMKRLFFIKINRVYNIILYK